MKPVRKPVVICEISKALSTGKQWQKKKFHIGKQNWSLGRRNLDKFVSFLPKVLLKRSQR